MKRIASLLLSIILLLSFCGCSVQFMKLEDQAAGDTPADEVSPYDGDAMFAFVSTSAGIDDGELNQRIYTVCSQFSEMFRVFFSYYVLPDDSTATMTTYLEGVVKDGYSVIVLPGSSFADAVLQCAEKNPGVFFIAVDVSEKDLNDRYRVPKNLCCVSFREELAGFLAGYASVGLGYDHLGFIGSKSDPAIKRYGSGYTQGANLASVELGIPVTLEYVYAGTNEADLSVRSTLISWYGDLGVQLVFAAGGNMADAAASIAAEKGGKVMGADFNRFAQINAYGDGICVSCAEKGYRNALKDILLNVIIEGDVSEHAGKLEVFSLVSSTDLQSNYAQLSYSDTQWSESFGTNEYSALVERILAGSVKISNNVENAPDVSITVNYYDNIK